MDLSGFFQYKRAVALSLFILISSFLFPTISSFHHHVHPKQRGLHHGLGLYGSRGLLQRLYVLYEMGDFAWRILPYEMQRSDSGYAVLWKGDLQCVLLQLR